MSRVGYGRTRHELCTVVQKIINDAGRETPFLENKPGRQWLRGFFKRHPYLSVRTTIQLGKERAVITTEKIQRWFAEFERYVKDELKDETLLLDPSRIYNADETGFSLCAHKNSKVVAKKGDPVVYHFGNSDKTQMTVMAAASASGHFVTPMIIYPGQRFAYDPLDGFEEAAFGRSENGWMDCEVFVCWLKNVFIPDINARQVKKPVLLLIDGHSTHITMKASDTCLENGIELYCLLEHSSHLIQPLDLRFFGTLKAAWRQSVRDWQTHNVGQFVTKQNFARVFKQAWTASTTVDAAVKGFHESGLFPFDPTKVMHSMKLQPSAIFSGEQLLTSSPANDVSVSHHNQPGASPARVETLPIQPVAPSVTTLDQSVDIPVLVTNNSVVLLERQPNQSVTATAIAPSESQPNKSVTPTVMLPNQSGAPSDIQPSQSVTPTVILPLQSVAPLDSQPNQTDAPNIMLDRPSVTLSVIQPNSPPTVTLPNQLIGMSDSQPNQSVAQTVMVTNQSEVPSVSPSNQLVTSTVLLTKKSATNDVSPVNKTNSPGYSPFSKHLKLPTLSSLTEKQKPNVQRVLMPKAITGSTYRSLLQEKIQKKEKELQQKSERKRIREENKKRKEEEKKLKNAEQEKKREARKAEKQRRLTIKRRKQENEEAILREINDSLSDSDVQVEAGKCFTCEKTYDNFIECTNCGRRFHFACVDIENQLICDELPFECKYC
ncbi:uncharacterized protein LOC127845476 [Dreissena polymorpha]|uniref:uncharacterized protein LOC127845476 n=1 Tax=Dreissena polymorpha TaxID=45954 RepID=UPI0022650826|nr:uncharacterized protein LOC127845476 [Dreissena polymorpha]